MNAIKDSCALVVQVDQSPLIKLQASNVSLAGIALKELQQLYLALEVLSENM